MNIQRLCALCGMLSILVGMSACYKIPIASLDAINVKIYRGKSSIKDCTYITEITGIVNTEGYGVRLLDAIDGAENDLKNKAVRYGGNVILVLHTESRLIDAGGYQFQQSFIQSNAANKIDEYIIYGEVYRCEV